MTPTDLPFSLPGFEVDEVREQTDLIEIFAHLKTAEAICPACQHRSRRIHSYYQCLPEDLPVSDRRVRLVLTVRHFHCQNERCPKHTFTERWPELLALHAQLRAVNGSCTSTPYELLSDRAHLWQLDLTVMG